MKLKLRSLESNETHRIEVPNTCNLKQLKQIIHLQFFPASSSSTGRESLFFSLNRKDELCGSSPDVSLQSLGVTSGDLIYFDQNPYAFSSQDSNFLQLRLGRNDQGDSLTNTQLQKCGEVGAFVVSSDEIRELRGAQMDGISKLNNSNFDYSDLELSLKVNSSKMNEFFGSSDGNEQLVGAHVEGGSNKSDPIDPHGNLVDTQMMESGNLGEMYGSNAVSSTRMEGLSGLSDHDEKMEGIEGTDGMEVDDEAHVRGVDATFFVPSFLKRMFMKEVGDATASGDFYKLFVIGVHAVMLESGFVDYDPVLGRKMDGFSIHHEWSSLASGVSLHYTLPCVLTSEVVETVVLKFQTLGKDVVVVGHLPKKGFEVHQICLEEHRFGRALSFLWKNSDGGYIEREMNGSMKLDPNHQVFECWKTAKDGISYPLLMDLCDHLKLDPPSSFILLPTELKIKILESLPAIDVAKVACVSSEMRFTASNNDLWNLKCKQEFGNVVDSWDVLSKARFVSSWQHQRKHADLLWRAATTEIRNAFQRMDPHRFRFPFIISGDHDHLPAFRFPQPPRWLFSGTDCNLNISL